MTRMDRMRNDDIGGRMNQEDILETVLRRKDWLRKTEKFQRRD